MEYEIYLNKKNKKSTINTKSSFNLPMSMILGSLGFMGYLVYYGIVSKHSNLIKQYSDNTSKMELKQNNASNPTYIVRGSIKIENLNNGKSSIKLYCESKSFKANPLEELVKPDFKNGMKLNSTRTKTIENLSKCNELYSKLLLN